MPASMLRKPRTASRSDRGHGAQAVKGGAGAPRGGRRAPLGADRSSIARRNHRVQRKSRLLGIQRLRAEVAALVKGRQQRQADAGGLGRGADRLPQAVWRRREVAPG